MNTDEKIVAYGKELGLDCLDVRLLIESHRHLRELAKKDQQLWLSQIKQAQDKAYQQVLDSTWIRIDDLRKMSVKDLVNLLSDE